MSQSFLNSGTLVILCLFATMGPQFYHFLVFFHINSDIVICRENPVKYPSWAKNPPNYTTAYIVQQSNCRWHGEPTYWTAVSTWDLNRCSFILQVALKMLSSATDMDLHPVDRRYQQLGVR